MLKNYITPIINMFVALQYPASPLLIGVAGRDLSLSSTLVSRMMLRLRSGGDRHNRGSRVTGQTTVVTLSDLSGELSSVPPSASVHFGGYGNEENLELK